MRARIAEDDPPEEALAKLARHDRGASCRTRRSASGSSRALQHLLGLTDRVAPDREDLHSAWRLFFERMAETGPVVLLFEDLHWADAGLLDFIEYLLDWSRSHPIYVLTLSRPELGDRHPTFGTRIRSSTALTLDPLDDEAMDSLLQGLVPGLPEELRATIRGRADGVPLYAVETVRMLLDRNLLEPRGDGYKVSGPVDKLEVPETLHALIAARLDGLDATERRVLEDAAVLGKTFATRGLAALSGHGRERPRAASRLARPERAADGPDGSALARTRASTDSFKRSSSESRTRRSRASERKARHLAAADLSRARGRSRAGRDRRGDRRPLPRRVCRRSRSR